jgi:hypothetical protein
MRGETNPSFQPSRDSGENRKPLAVVVDSGPGGFARAPE